MNLFSKKSKKPTSLLESLKQQDAAAEQFRRSEEARQASQLCTAHGLLVELRTLLHVSISVSIDSEIRPAPLGAMTYLVFSIPADIRTEVATRVRCPDHRNQIRIQMYPANNSNHDRMTEELAALVRGIRDIRREHPFGVVECVDPSDEHKSTLMTVPRPL